MIFYIYFVMTPNLLTKPKMENVWIFSGELDCDFAEEATFIDHGGVNHIGGDDSIGKQQEKEPTFDHSSEESIYPRILGRRTG